MNPEDHVSFLGKCYWDLRTVKFLYETSRVCHLFSLESQDRDVQSSPAEKNTSWAQDGEVMGMEREGMHILLFDERTQASSYVIA